MSLRVNCFGKTHPLSLVVSFFLTVCNFCLVWEGRVVVAAIERYGKNFMRQSLAKGL